MAETPEDHLADLLVDSLAGRLTESTRQELSDWGLSNPEVDRLIQEFHNPVTASADMAAWRRIDSKKAYRRWRGRIRRRRLRKLQPYTYLLIAVLVIGAIVWWRVYHPFVQPSNVQRKTPPPGVVQPLAPVERIYEEKALAVNGENDTTTMRTLPDGTKVWLNSKSRLSYPAQFAGKERVVELSGEAYFDVVRQPKAFIVKAAGIRVQVTGTRFDVNAYTDEDSIRTTLFDGGVRMQKGDRSVVMKPGDQVAVAQGSVELTRPRKVSLPEVVGWKDKNAFYFSPHDGLRAVIRKIARWYDVEPEFHGNVPDKSHYSGSIGRDLPLLDVLEALKFPGIKFSIEGQRLIIESTNTQ